MKTPVKILLALVAGIGVAGLSIYLYETLFRLLHEVGVSFDTPYSENPFSPFDRYRTLLAAIVGVLTVFLLLGPTRWSSRRVSMLVLGTWALSWGSLLLDAAVRSTKGGPTFTTQLDWYLLPTLAMASTFAVVLALLLATHLRLRRQATAL